MISRELAEKLKNAGLEWKLKKFDLYTGKVDYIYSIPHDLKESELREFKRRFKDLLWLPSLSQLLAEIEKRGYGWIVEKVVSEKAYDLTLIKETGWGLGEKYFSNADTPLEEAVGQALLWIFKEGGSND